MIYIFVGGWMINVCWLEVKSLSYIEKKIFLGGGGVGVSV